MALYQGMKVAMVVIGALLLLYGTVAVFRAFDMNSHSNSDTLRPFILTMTPVWAVYAGGAWALLRRRIDA